MTSSGVSERALRVLLRRHRMGKQHAQPATRVIANGMPDGHRPAHLGEQLGGRDVVWRRGNADRAVRYERLTLAAPGAFELAQVLRDQVELEPVSPAERQERSRRCRAHRSRRPLPA